MFKLMSLKVGSDSVLFFKVGKSVPSRSRSYI